MENVVLDTGLTEPAPHFVTEHVWASPLQLKKKIQLGVVASAVIIVSTGNSVNSSVKGQPWLLNGF